MSAARIRQAAKVLRDAADGTTAGLWASSAEQHENPGYGITQMTCAGCGWDDPRFEADANYIALMQPRVALALADWLDAEFDWVESNKRSVTFGGVPMFPPHENALTLADTILGGKS